MKVRVTGIVQGVGFRPFIYRTAIENKLNGYVLNKGDAGVEILLEGSETNISNFLHDLKEKTPPLARIYEVITSRLQSENQYTSFKIQKSSNRIEQSGSVIPPDIAICNDCLRELRDPRDPRCEYFFITCTNCGPRFTIIEKLPYDRENTTMKDFPMCGFCLTEYREPSNRRFHAQTVACPNCGPHAYLTDNRGSLVSVEDPIRETGTLLSKGKIVAVKGYGGFHIAISTTKDEPLARLRQVKHRSGKPFAIMARSLEAIRTFAEINRKQVDLLTSPARPIVLVNKSSNYNLSDLIAPGLHNIGVMLPYSAMHCMLFDGVKDVAFIMTSANPPNQPIVNDNQEALDILGDTVDYFLFHDRKIAHRCDDSVVRAHGDDAVFLRRSRGYAPAPLLLKERADGCVLALGGELNNTACVLNGNRAFLTQHVGDVENLETVTFLESAADHLMSLTNTEVGTVVCDLHPKFTTTVLAKKMAEKNRWRFIQVQHHFAHIAGLMAEHDVDSVVGVCCDGYGYGVDGQAWGGEVLLCRRRMKGFRRVAHLQGHPLVGGDLATRYPLRMAAAILRGRSDVSNWLLENARLFPHGRQEVETLLKQIDSRKGLTATTSCGRVLDAVAAVLNVCVERTYEGEPSMKLESCARDGRDVLELKPEINGDVLDTAVLLHEVFDNRIRCRPRDLAYSAHAYLAEGLATLALNQADKHHVENIGFSGGVACNEIITSIMRKRVEKEGPRFFLHREIPPGDGGLSFGQAVVAGFFNPTP
jgi:hydrogenase maturation protein HypF